ncbi:DNA damage-inducible transcript 3 protein [Alligator mississippiensis]|uniref:DNA damage-inducible transcript 3 protein n=1 Tax=Alligator mississippiensis TaxID=8496 RepID=UPI0003D0A3C0|nr:DNA damage-inducible transcript 3 protein [Alligator mississippiensis]
MAAEPLPLGVGATGPLPSWELEAWYEDLQEVLSSEETGRQPQLPGVAEQEELKDLATLDTTALLWGLDTPVPAETPELDSELLELLSVTAPMPAGPLGSDSSLSSPTHTGPEDEEGGAGCRRGKQLVGGRARRRRREQEQEAERRVAELTAQNARLRAEIDRLSTQVEATRAALIERMVNLRQA